MAILFPSLKFFNGVLWPRGKIQATFIIWSLLVWRFSAQLSPSNSFDNGPNPPSPLTGVHEPAPWPDLLSPEWAFDIVGSVSFLTRNSVQC